MPITQWPLPTGYGMAGDLKSLGASCPALAQVQKQLQGGLDLLQVHRQVSGAGGVCPLVLPGPSPVP